MNISKQRYTNKNIAIAIYFITLAKSTINSSSNIELPLRSSIQKYVNAIQLSYTTNRLQFSVLYIVKRLN